MSTYVWSYNQADCRKKHPFDIQEQAAQRWKVDNEIEIKAWW